MDKAGSGEDKVDYYSVLGCDPSSSEEQIMTEYRVRARQSHPDKQGDTEEFQTLQEAKETLVDRAKRTLYDKWMNSGIDMSFKQWENLKDSVQTSLHWATPKNERMLPDGEENNRKAEDKTEDGIENMDKVSEVLGKKPILQRQDSCHPTIVMLNKQDDLRKKFRNYEI